jgi:DNA polymerase-3 subunit epsilon/DNA polymerase-3 subunit alpha (Gram-positive type)
MSNILDNITVFDFETSGLDPEKNSVIEVAAIKIREGRLVGEFSTIIKQPIQLEARITEVTGITTEDLKSGMDELLAFKLLNHLMEDSILVAHNAPFDLQFLHHSLVRIAGRTFNNPFIDTLTISRDRHFYPHKLEDMCDKYDIKLEGAHRALNDVHGCWELLKKLHAEKDVSEFANKLGYLKKYPAPKWYPDYAELVPMVNRYDNTKKKFY